MPRLRCFVIVAATALSLAPGYLRAQEGTAKDAEEFGHALARFRYTDLANEVIDKALANSPTPPEKASLEFVKAEIKVEEAKLLPDIKARVAALREGADAFLAYLKNNPDSPRANEVRITSVDLLRLASENIINTLKSDKDKAKAEDYRKDAKDCFNKALSIMEPRIAELQAVEERNDKDNAELMALRFQTGKMHQLYAGMFDDKKSVESQTHLQKAREVLEEFQIDYSSEVLSFEATKILAAICLDEGKVDEALDQMKEGCGQLVDAVHENPRLGDDDVIRDLVAGMFLDLAKIYLERKNLPGEAVTAIENIEREMPALVKSAEGRQALVLVAGVHMNEGRNDKAKAIVDRVLKEDETSSTAEKAREIKDKTSVGGGTGLDGLLKALEAAIAQRDIARAEKVAARVLGQRTVDAHPEECAQALLYMGGLYFDTGRTYDAVQCFVAVCEDYPKSPQAPQAKANEGTCYSRLYTIERQNFWKDRVRKAFDELQKTYPDSIEAKEQAYTNGLILEQENKLPECIESFKKVITTSAKYGDAQYRIGKNSITLAEEAETRGRTADAKARSVEGETALKIARATFLRMAGETLNEADIRRNRELAFDCGIRLVGIYLRSETKDLAKCEQIVGDLEKDAKDEKEKKAKVLSLQIKVFAAAGKGDLAEKAYDDYIKSGNTGAGDAAMAIGSALDKQAAEIAKKSGITAPDAVALWKRASKFYVRAVTDMRTGGPKKDAAKVGSRLLSIAAVVMGVRQDVPFIDIDPNVKLAEKELVESANSAFSYVPAPEGDDVAVDLQRNIARGAALSGKWEDAVKALDKIVTKYALFSKDGKYDDAMAKKIPGLAFVYQDYAVACIRFGKARNLPDFFTTANSTLSNLINAADKTGQLYWECRYLNLLSMYLAGDYDRFKGVLDLLERRSPDFDGDPNDKNGKFGVKKKILELKKDAETKIISR